MLSPDADADAFGRQTNQGRRIVGFEAHQRLEAVRSERRDRQQAAALLSGEVRIRRSAAMSSR